MKKILTFILFIISVHFSMAQITVNANIAEGFPLMATKACDIMVSKEAGITVTKVANLFADDIQRVTDFRPNIYTASKPKGKYAVVVGTIQGNAYLRNLAERGLIDADSLNGRWERYMVKVIESPSKGVDKVLVIVGSDRRGAAYGTFSVSEAIGVSPWYWWADVPVRKNKQLLLTADVLSQSPTVKYRGFFINDEDWGLKPWASKNFEQNLGDIGSKTYARVCELLLRMKANMLAPAMHSCTGAFYSHADSKLVADTFGIIITTSHCEPLLLNNAAHSEWDMKTDGDWNYKTNKDAIVNKWDRRLSEASCFENIYTTAMRGLHDAGLRGDLPMNERVQLIEQVIADQRKLLEKHIGKQVEDIPQIFVPYKETMDIYENGLRVPDDVTLVWVDDNYGYMKRVSNPVEQMRKGGAGVYYHLSYLGGPHDYLWLNTTPPVLMYEELKKAFDTGADRYWLLNVGDIKPMELGITTFMDMAWDIHSFDIDNVNRHQSRMLSQLFGLQYYNDFQLILDKYYQLAWSRKPEFMGWEREWDAPQYTGLKDTEYSFDNYNEAQCRLADYQYLSDLVSDISESLDSSLRPAFFEMLEYPVKGACQMNRKFLMAQLNHEMHKSGETPKANWAARKTKEAADSINTLTKQYNNLLNGKWNGMMNLAPGWCALYQKIPELYIAEGINEIPCDVSLDNKKQWLDDCYVVDLRHYSRIKNSPEKQIRLVDGLGYDWHVVQLGNATDATTDPTSAYSPCVEYTLPAINKDTIEVIVHTVPFFPLHEGRGTSIGISVDDSQPEVYQNIFKEYSLEWNNQVLQNGDVALIRFGIDKSRKEHKLSFICGDSGMMIQKVIINWGGLKPSYLGPTKNLLRIR